MKKYPLLALLCLFFASCSENIIDFQSHPHKEIRAMTWSPDGQTLVVFAAYPVSASSYQYKFYTYNTKGEKLSETPSLNLQRYYFSKFYLSSDAKYAIAGDYPVNVVELSTGKVVATYEYLTIGSQAFGTDEFIVMSGEDRYSSGPYYEYKKVRLNTSTIDTLSRFRLLSYYGYSQNYYPNYASQKRMITSEYDSLNNVHIVVRDSSFNVLCKTIPLNNFPLYNSSVSVNGDRVVYSYYSDVKFILDLSNGAIDTSHALTFIGDYVEISGDGKRIYGAVKNSSSIQSYDIASRVYTPINTFPNTSYSKLLTLSPDDKHVAFALYDFEKDDQLTIVDLP